MKPKTHLSSGQGRAFTLMELLVVISVIAVLAALLFPAGAAIKRKATINKARAQLRQVAELIERYQTRFGYLPPDNPAQPARNSLYFELVGSTREEDAAHNFSYTSLDGAARISEVDCEDAFGVKAILNSTKSTGEESKPAEPFLKQLRQEQYYQYTKGGSTIRLLTCAVPWPESSGQVIAGTQANPWRYLKNGTNNPGSFDLWVDLVLGGKTNRIGNWHDGTPQIVSY